MLWTTWISIGAVLAALAVISGAFGAHALQERLPAASLVTWETACRYHLYHALAVLVCGLIGTRIDNAWLQWGAWLFVGGILLFSGSLYAYALIQTRWLAFMTPAGGAAFILAWILLVVAVNKGS